MSRFAVCAALLAVLAAVAPATSPDPRALAVAPDEVARARELIRRLGSESFRERDRAARELRQMGRAALPVLAEAATTEADPEVKARCGELLPAAEADDLAARLAAFQADADGKFKHDLPGWDEFRAAAGDDATARKLYADMLHDRENRRLLAALRGPGGDLGKAISARLQLILYRIQPPYGQPPGFRPVQPEAPDIAALLLAESLAPDRTMLFIGSQYHLQTYFYQPVGRDAAAGRGAYGQVFRKLTLRWLDTREGANGLMTAMNLAKQLDFGDAQVAKYAAKTLSADGVHPWNKANALRVLAQAGAKEHLPAVAKLFADDAVLMKGGQNGAGTDDILLKDAALAMALRLTDQDVKEYGLDQTPQGDNVQYVPTAYRFRTDDKTTAAQKREAAFKKWEAWAVKNLKDGRLVEVKKP